MRIPALILPVLTVLAAEAAAQQPTPAPRTIARPPVLAARLTYAGTCIPARGSVFFTGSGLPATRGDRRIAAEVEGKAVELAVASWTANGITVRLPEGLRLPPGGSYPVGIQDAKGVWVLKADRPLVLCATTPAAPPVARVAPPLPPLAAPTKPRGPGAPPLAGAPAKPAEKPVAEPQEETGKPADEHAEAAGPALPSEPAAAPTERPPEPGGTRSLAAPAIRLTGYGTAAPPREPFPTRAITTPAIRLSGHTAERAPFEPRTIPTPPIRLSGVRSEP